MHNRDLEPCTTVQPKDGGAVSQRNILWKVPLPSWQRCCLLTRAPNLATLGLIPDLRLETPR